MSTYMFNTAVVRFGFGEVTTMNSTLLAAAMKSSGCSAIMTVRDSSGQWLGAQLVSPANGAFFKATGSATHTNPSLIQDNATYSDWNAEVEGVGTWVSASNVWSASGFGSNVAIVITGDSTWESAMATLAALTGAHELDILFHAPNVPALHQI